MTDTVALPGSLLAHPETLVDPRVPPASIYHSEEALALQRHYIAQGATPEVALNATLAMFRRADDYGRDLESIFHHMRSEVLH